MIYAEDERFRLRWVAGLMLANWLVMNSGTVKEAYMFIAVLNAIGVLHFILERPRFGGKFKNLVGLVGREWRLFFDDHGAGVGYVF